ncbi:fibronectin type 3 and ankyrin repeat domain protein 1, partial [Pyrenochaeta sp. DS3sAY3a]
LRKALATLPQTLDQTYDRILTAISEEDREYAMRILQWLTFSLRPMSVDEISEVVAIDVARDPAFDRDEVLEDPLEALSICSSLVTISTIQPKEESDSAQQILTLAHYSVKEYLVSDRIKQGPATRFNINESQCHGFMMDGCLKYLLHLQQPLSEEAIQTSTLARYAAEFWSSHLRQTGEDMQRLSQAAMSLMSTENPAYLTWIQLYDLDHLNTVVKLLLDQGAKVDTQGGRYDNALHAASAKGHNEVVQTLLKAGADIYAPATYIGNALYAASCGGHELIIKMLLENDVDVNAQGGTYGSALQAAVAHSHQAITQLLLDYGANVNQQGGQYGNALNAAISRGNMAIIELLL